MPLKFLVVLRFELAKAARLKMTWVALALPSLAAAATVWLDSLSRRVQTAAGLEKPFTPSAYVGFSKGAANGFVIGGILLLLYSSMAVAGEGHWRTFKTIMLRPLSRLEWVAGKFSLLLLLALAMAAAIAGSALLAARCGGPFVDIVDESFASNVYCTSAEMAHHSLAAIGLALPPLIALAAFGMMFSTLTDHTGMAASATLGAYIVLETAKGAMTDGKLYLFNTFVPSLVDTSYFQALKAYADGRLDMGWEPQRIWLNLGAPLAWAAVCGAVSAVAFSRRNFLV